MLVFEVLAHPLDEMVLEYTLNELVKDVWGY